MFLFAIAPVDHTETGHAKRSAILINRDRVRDRAGTSPIRIEIDKSADIPFPAKLIGGIVVMSRVQAEISDRDIRIYGLKFPEGDNGTDTVVPSGIQETDMEREVNAGIRIMRAEHVKGMPEIKNFLITVPSPVCIGVREMALTGTARNAGFAAATDPMAIGGSMGMDTGAVAGECNTVCGKKAVPEGRDERGKSEKLLEAFFIMEREAFMGESINRQFLCNAGVFIGKLLSLSGFLGRLGVLILWKKILPAGFL